MTSSSHPQTKRFDLIERTLRFAKQTRHFCSSVKKCTVCYDDLNQLMRSSGSVGANYIEANESLGKKDFIMHIRIARKEAKESHYWIQILDTNLPTELEVVRKQLLKEAHELMLILSAIERKISSK